MYKVLYTDERTLQTDVMKWFKTQSKCKAIRIVDRYNSGYSDVHACIDGRCVWIELKDDTGKPSKLQELFLEEMADAGAYCFICRTVGEVQDAVNYVRGARADEGRAQRYY